MRILKKKRENHVYLGRFYYCLLFLPVSFILFFGAGVFSDKEVFFIVLTTIFECFCFGLFFYALKEKVRIFYFYPFFYFLSWVVLGYSFFFALSWKNGVMGVQNNDPRIVVGILAVSAVLMAFNLARKEMIRLQYAITLYISLLLFAWGLFTYLSERKVKGSTGRSSENVLYASVNKQFLTKTPFLQKPNVHLIWIEHEMEDAEKSALSRRLTTVMGMKVMTLDRWWWSFRPEEKAVLFGFWDEEYRETGSPREKKRYLYELSRRIYENNGMLKLFKENGYRTLYRLSDFDSRLYRYGFDDYTDGERFMNRREKIRTTLEASPFFYVESRVLGFLSKETTGKEGKKSGKPLFTFDDHFGQNGVEFSTEEVAREVEKIRNQNPDSLIIVVDSDEDRAKQELFIYGKDPEVLKSIPPVESLADVFVSLIAYTTGVIPLNYETFVREKKNTPSQ